MGVVLVHSMVVMWNANVYRVQIFELNAGLYEASIICRLPWDIGAENTRNGIFLKQFTLDKQGRSFSFRLFTNR